METDEIQEPPLPKGFVKHEDVPSLPSGFSPLKKKGSSPSLDASENQSSNSQIGSTSGFQKINLSKPMAKSELPVFQMEGTDRKKNSWNNLGDFVPQTVLGGLDKDAGQAIRFVGDNFGMSAPGKNPVSRLGQKLEGWGDEHNQQAQQHQLPNTTGGSLVTGTTNLAPMLMELALTPELDVAKVGKLGEVLTKYGGKYAPKAANMVGGKFPTLMGAKGLTSGYTEAIDKGATHDEALKAGLINSAEEAGKGVLYEAAGAAAGKVAEVGSKALEDAGLMSKGKIVSSAQKALLNSAAQGTAFSAVPFVTNALQGKSTSMDDLKNNFIFGGLLGAFHGDGEKDPEKPTAADGAAKEMLERSPVIDLHNFMTADMDAIKYAHELDTKPLDLQMQSAAHAEKAFNEENPEEKQNQIVQSSLNGKLASVKSVTQAILKDKQAVIDAVPDIEGKEQIVEKINQVHKELDPTEQKKTALGQQISDVDEQIKAASEKVDDPVMQAENEVKLEGLTKQREELNNGLKDLIIKQNEQTTPNKEIPVEQSADEAVSVPKVADQNDETTENPSIKPVENESRNENNGEKSSQESSEKGSTESKIGNEENGAEKSNVKPTGGAEPSPVTKTKEDATKEIKQQESGEPKYQKGDKSGETTETSSSNSPVGTAEGKGTEAVKPRFKIKGDKITPLPLHEHSELNGLLKEHDVTIQDLKNEHAQRNNSSEVDSETTTDAKVVQQPENDSPANDGEHRQGEAPKSRKSTFKRPGEEKVEEPAGIKKVISDATREKKELPDVKLSKLGKDAETLELGKKLVGTEQVKPSEVVERVISHKGIYSPDEAAGMQYYMHQLRTEETNLRSQLSDIDNEPAPTKEHEQAKSLILGNLRQLDDRIDEATHANRINSRSWSNLGNIMQIESDASFSPSNIRSIIKDNYNGEIPKDVEERLDKANKERDKAIDDLKRANEYFTAKQGEQIVTRIRKSIGLVKQSKAELVVEEAELKSQLIRAFKKDISRLNSGIPLPTETLAVLGKLAVNYFKQGVKDFEGLTNKIYDDIKEHLPGVEKDDIKSYLSSYDPIREASKQRDIDLLGRKERSAEKQIATGKIIDRTVKPKIVYPKDDAIIKAEQRVRNAEFKLKQEKAKSYKFSQSSAQRGLNFITRWERRFVLSNLGILEKLASAVTIGGGLKRLPEELVGGLIWSKLFKAMADKAPIEGGFNAKAEAEYWKEFSNPKKFIHNAKEILKEGSSDLTKEFSTTPHEHYRYYDALTDLHPIIKDISKRATYEASLIKGYAWAERNGLDISDPLIRQSVKQQAYNRAEYEIFQEDSQWGKRLQNFLRDNRQPKSTKDMLVKFITKFMLPVNLVPLNIVRRVGNYVTGLPRGLVNAREAYKNGIENLSNEQAEIIMKQLKQGSMGAALFSMGLFGVGGSFGGLYNKDDKGGMRRKGEDSPGFDEMYFHGLNIHKPLQHALPLQIIQLGATYRDIFNLYNNKYQHGYGEDKNWFESILEANAQAMMGSVGAEAEQIPMVETPFEMYGSLSDPYQRKRLGKDMMRRVTPTIATDAYKLAKGDK